MLVGFWFLVHDFLLLVCISIFYIYHGLCILLSQESWSSISWFHKAYGCIRPLFSRTWHIVILVPHTLVHSVEYNIKLRLFTPLQHNFIICPLPCILLSILRVHPCSPNLHVLSRGHNFPSSSSFLILPWLGHHATSLILLATIFYSSLI